MKNIVLILTAIVLLSGCYQNSAELQTSVIKNNDLKLGFCPTMQSDAQNLQIQNDNIEIVPFGSANEVLANLKAKKIDLALIGRKAELNELPKEILEKKLFKTGFTLIAPQKSFISESELKNLEVKTCLEENLVKVEFIELKNITFEKNPDCNLNNQEMWLIAWDDLIDSMELLIPVDQSGNKIKKYRSPFLYGQNLNVNF